MTRIIKRDGTVVAFDSSKIRNAIANANKRSQEMQPDDLDRITAIISNKCQKLSDEIDVEKVQDIVEQSLQASRFKETAKQFILYRDSRTRNRREKSRLHQKYGRKLLGLDIVNQNANIDEASFGGRKGEASNEYLKEFALYDCMCEKSRNHHLNNEIYIHDLDSYAVGMHNCLSLPIDKLMAEGATTRQTDIRPANSINTFFQLLAVYFQLQSLQQFGGVSATHVDWSAAPYFTKSFMKHYIASFLKSQSDFINLDLEALMFEDYEETILDANGKKFLITRNKLEDWIEAHKQEFFEKYHFKEEDFKLSNRANLDPILYQSALYDTIVETKQAVEGMYHNLNTLQSRSGNQLPFTSINYGTCTSKEGRIIIRALLAANIKGVGKVHRTAIFPCGIFQCMKGINRKPGDPNYDLFKLALESTSKRLYPNYANVDWSNNTGYDLADPKTYFSTMGCRTANGYDINAEPGTNPQTKDGRGNICPVTIILPTIAMEAGRNVEDFIHLLDKMISDAKDMLIERYKYICAQSPDSAKFMYENNIMLGYKPEEGIESAMKHGTLAIGQLGLAETLQLLVGKDQTTPEGMELAKRIEGLFKQRCDEFKKKYKLNFGVYYTPAENLCYTAMTKFKKQYGEIPYVSDRKYFTNSIHVPVWKQITAFEKIDVESQLTGYSNAGCITYVEVGSATQHNLEALETVVNYAMDHDIPYFAINVPNDTCLDCGYTGEFNDHCPQCNSKNFIQLRRVTGYLTGNYTTAFNAGKQQETEDRVKHM